MGSERAVDMGVRTAGTLTQDLKKFTSPIVDPRQLFADERNTGFCVYCGGEPVTRDHVPSRVLLDEPYPADLPVVPACEPCNGSYSKDEEYVACLIDCAVSGTAEPNVKGRVKIGRILREHPPLAALLSQCRGVDEASRLIWKPDCHRVRNVVVKLARGHAAYEFSEPRLDEPASVSFAPFCAMSPEQANSFESTTTGPMVWQEIGSRAFIRACRGQPEEFRGGWVDVQAGRYRYMVAELNGLVVRSVMSEYLACEVVWD